jgi:hypothetical protein
LSFYAGAEDLEDGGADEPNDPDEAVAPVRLSTGLPSPP